MDVCVCVVCVGVFGVCVFGVCVFGVCVLVCVCVHGASLVWGQLLAQAAPGQGVDCALLGFVTKKREKTSYSIVFPPK